MPHPLRAAALAALLLAGAVACGDSSDEGTSTAESSGSSSPAPAPADDAAGGSAAARVEAVNETMRTTAFSAIGTSTAYDGALQNMTWNPRQGLHIRISGTIGGHMYCQDGVTYISSNLFAESLKQQGQEITVPADLDDVYVTTKSGRAATPTSPCPRPDASPRPTTPR